jgi:hypothetical protein
MSKASARRIPFSAERSCARMAPPAGPLSTSRTGKRRAVSTVVTPPEDIISSNGADAPSPRSPSSSRLR